MKRTYYFFLISLLASLSFGADDKVLPSPQISTPADKPVSSKNWTLGEKESSDWQKMRMERQKAREEILSKIRESSGQEKEQLRRRLSKIGTMTPALMGIPKRMKSRERTPFFERPESHNVRPMREKEFPPPCPGDCHGH